MKHFIRQQYLHVEVFGTESDGLALHSRLPDWCHHWLTPALERVMERCAPPEGRLYIERLEVDAGALRLDRWERDLTESVARAVEKALSERTLAGGSAAAIISGEVQHKSLLRSLHEALIYFLETGSLPWSFHLPAGSSLEQVVFDSWQEAEASGLAPASLNGPMLRALSSPIVRQRLTRHFSPRFLEALLALLAPQGQQVMGALLQTLRRAAAPPALIKQFEQRLWESLFARVAVGAALTAADLAGEAWSALAADVTGKTALFRVLEEHFPDVTGRAPAADRRIELGKTAAPGPPESPPPPERPRPGDASRHPEAIEGIYIENAGLVILHPFLPQFFGALDIAAEDRLLQPERGLCLLHFLATGQAVAPEYELVLPKILCNIPVEEPVDTGLELTDLEKEEAAALLEAVIRHWEALRNTSPDGLRGTFLLRPGKISLRDDGDWLLQVEAQAFDILLEHLPWGLSMIKLPWMERMLWVEWR
jgi:hypothetical protein